MRNILATAIVASFAASTAQGFTAINGLGVNPVPGGFEVVAQGADGPRQIWCAAGEYSRRVEGNGNNVRIHILRPYGPSQTRPGWRAVQFTTRPSPALADGPRLGDGGNYSVQLKTPGFSLTTGHAENFCSDVWENLTDRWPLN